MYAVVKTGGKQYRVEQGQKITVERVPAETGETVQLEPIMLRDQSVLVTKDELVGVTVEAKVVEHLRGPKLRVAKFKPKRGYKRRTGHRQEQTLLEVTSIKAAA